MSNADDAVGKRILEAMAKAREFERLRAEQEARAECACEGAWKDGIFVHARDCARRAWLPQYYAERMFEVSNPPVGRKEKRIAAFNAEYAKKHPEKVNA